MSNLEEILSQLFKDVKLSAPLAAVLTRACQADSISYNQTREIARDSTDEVLLFSNEWRLLLPLRVEKSGAWEDRLLLCRPGESYTPPNVARHLIRNALKTGQWDPMTAIAGVFNEIGEPDWQSIPELVMELGNQAIDGQINGARIGEICVGAHLGNKVDLLIAELKAAGIMSPRLAPVAEVARAGSPMYELNPSLFVNYEEK